MIVNLLFVICLNPTLHIVAVRQPLGGRRRFLSGDGTGWKIYQFRFFFLLIHGQDVISVLEPDL